MAFPPNYRQERNNRDRAKQQKAAEKQAKKLADKLAERKPDAETSTPEAGDNKDHL